MNCRFVYVNSSKNKEHTEYKIMLMTVLELSKSSVEFVSTLNSLTVLPAHHYVLVRHNLFKNYYKYKNCFIIFRKIRN